MLSVLFVILSLISLINCRSIEVRLPDQDVPEETPEETFLRSDTNKDNQLSFDEFLRTELVYVLVKQDEFNNYDTNKDGIVSRNEYEAVHKKEQQQNAELQAQYYAQLFEEFDEDFDMKLNENEVRNFFAKRLLLKPGDNNNFEKTFKKYDVDRDGALDIAGLISSSFFFCLLFFFLLL
ncbi:unnamed protein product [Enterobius vermicularis]|uniref:EF-hand domain-containing protein n=1 Tax=Enterobius vermicularis TaxID=51028 RepID=A0A0N4VRA2_ENTVE|nr:unnamed protein product [Enterobius vermicularis]